MDAVGGFLGKNCSRDRTDDLSGEGSAAVGFCGRLIRRIERSCSAAD